MTRPADLHLLGVSFRTAPVAVREALHFDREQALGFLRELAADHPDLEVLVVSTCNRSEFYLAGGDGVGAVEALLAALRRARPTAPVLRAGRAKAAIRVTNRSRRHVPAPAAERAPA